MDKLAVFIVIIMTPIVFLFALGQYNDSAAQREYARAAMVREQSQARSDYMAAALPYVAIVGIMIFGGGVFVAVFVFAFRYADRAVISGPAQPLHIVERYYVVLPAGESRRAMWENVTNYQKQIEAKIER